MVKKGKTPVLSAEESRGLLERIDLSTLAGLRDRALIGVLVFSFVRVSAAVSMRISDYYAQGRRSFFRLHEKGGRYNVVPAHHLAQEYVDAYLEAAELGEDRQGPLFRSFAVGRQDWLEGRAMTRAMALRMIKRRTRQAGLPAEICAHSFRGDRDHGVSPERRRSRGRGMRIAGHESTRTTQLYNRIQDENALDVIERIHIRERAECNVGGVCAYLWRAKRLGIDARTCLPRTLLVAGYRLNSSTSRNPVSICASTVLETRPTRSERNRLSRVMICETLTTDFFVRPVPRRARGTLPGAVARFRFDMMASATTVRILLRLKSSDWMTRTGRR